MEGPDAPARELQEQLEFGSVVGQNTDKQRTPSSALSVSGKLVSMVLSQNLDRLSVYVPATKAAIMRRGFICTSLIGTTSGIIKLTTTGTFASRNGQRALEIELKNVTSVNY